MGGDDAALRFLVLLGCAIVDVIDRAVAFHDIELDYFDDLARDVWDRA